MSRRLVALSVHPSRDQIVLGIGAAHTEEALTRIARFLLRRGHDLAWSGALGPGALAFHLYELVRAENDRESEPSAKPSPSTRLRRIVHFLDKTQQRALTPKVHAGCFGVARFVTDPSRARDLDGHQVPAPSARIVLGGDTTPASLRENLTTWGVAPGTTPAWLVLGGFGGLAATLASGILQRSLPPVLAKLGAECAEVVRLCDEGVPSLARRAGLAEDAAERLLTTRDFDAALAILGRARCLAARGRSGSPDRLAGGEDR